jgi:hypothetical protein
VLPWGQHNTASVPVLLSGTQYEFIAQHQFDGKFGPQLATRFGAPHVSRAKIFDPCDIESDSAAAE